MTDLTSLLWPHRAVGLLGLGCKFGSALGPNALSINCNIAARSSSSPDSSGGLSGDTRQCLSVVTNQLSSLHDRSAQWRADALIVASTASSPSPRDSGTQHLALVLYRAYPLHGNVHALGRYVDRRRGYVRPHAVRSSRPSLLAFAELRVSTLFLCVFTSFCRRDGRRQTGSQLRL